MFTKERFQELLQGWKRISHGKAATCEDHLVYNLFRERPINFGFADVKSKVKLNNGMRPDHARDPFIRTCKALHTRWGQPERVKLMSQFAVLFTDGELMTITSRFKEG